MTGLCAGDAVGTAGTKPVTGRSGNVERGTLRVVPVDLDTRGRREGVSGVGLLVAPGII